MSCINKGSKSISAALGQNKKESKKAISDERSYTSVCMKLHTHICLLRSCGCKLFYERMGIQTESLLAGHLILANILVRLVKVESEDGERAFCLTFSIQRSEIQKYTCSTI